MQNSNDQTTKQRRKDIASFGDDYDGWALGAMATLAESGLDEAISEIDPSIEGKRNEFFLEKRTEITRRASSREVDQTANWGRGKK